MSHGAINRTIPRTGQQRDAVTRWIARFLVRGGLFAVGDIRGLASDYLAEAEDGSTFVDWLVARAILPQNCVDYVEHLFAESRFRCGNCGTQSLGRDASDGERMTCAHCGYHEFSICGTGNSGVFKTASAAPDTREASSSSRRRAPVLGSSDEHALPAEPAEPAPAAAPAEPTAVDPFGGLEPDASTTSMLVEDEMWSSAESLDEVHLPAGLDLAAAGTARTNDGDAAADDADDDTSVTTTTAGAVQTVAELLRQVEAIAGDATLAVVAPDGTRVGTIARIAGTVVAVSRGATADGPLEDPSDDEVNNWLRETGGTASAIVAALDRAPLPVERIRASVARAFGRELRNIVAGFPRGLRVSEDAAPAAALAHDHDERLRFWPLELMVAVTAGSVDPGHDLTSSLYEQWAPAADAAILLLRPTRRTGHTPVPLSVRGLESLPVSELNALCQAALGTGWSPRLAEAGQTPRLIVRTDPAGCAWASACTPGRLLLLRLDTSDKYKRVLARLLSDSISRLDPDRDSSSD